MTGGQDPAVEIWEGALRHPDVVECSVVTAREGGGRQRCLEKPADHHGPHWKNVEPIECDCRFICPGHADEPTADRRVPWYPPEWDQD